MWPLSTNLSIKISCFNYSIKQLSSIKIIKTITLTDKGIINELTPKSNGPIRTKYMDKRKEKERSLYFTL